MCVVGGMRGNWVKRNNERGQFARNERQRSERLMLEREVYSY
jgi:hypothetical protein